MNDTPSGSLEAMRLRRLEERRKRPRPEKDAPRLKAIFPQSGQSLRDALDEGLRLMASLIGASRYFEEWRVVRTEAEHRANTGLDPLKDPEAWFDHVIGQKNGEDYFSYDVLAFSTKIKQEDPRYYAATMGYRSGALAPRPPSLGLGFALTDPDHNMTLEEYARVIEIIVTWKRPVYISVGPSSYAIYDRVFDHRAWDAWLGWFPATIHASDLPDHALAIPIGPGTLVATQETNVIARLDDHRARAQAVEVALAELGVLPTLEALRTP